MRAKQRNALPKSAFALPSKRKYPIDTKKRAKAALSYSARKNTTGSYTTIRRAVLKKYPSLKKR
jgi:hypothetical protein